ncbi:hypothetical protein K8Z61_07565 [Nocardioides sp. TRM66260-LWL]|uniref:hypothetical protein n=1 Tax=Nocardioides sp. TRM66260-LWL TaxID=2874478 RepID=UPI001CC6721E|nr:hypothetical protein [Nocardioides sp. TRM66260-LWL]MBZ5734351.1 hypothetical protein [Nocardioides sp. TRM66260-LWL]
MTAGDWAALTLVALAGCLAASVLAWWRPRAGGPAALGALALAGVLAGAPAEVVARPHAVLALLVAVAAGCAVAGGGPLTTLVFDVVDRREPPDDRLAAAGRVLRGGAWIGGLERLAVLATLVAGWPEGLAVVLAVKGLGRYPELRAAEDAVRTGAAERFIIGTLVSVLWAAACAGVVVLAR